MAAQEFLGSRPHQSGLPRKVCLRLRPLTSVLGHNAQPVPRTPAQGLLGAGIGAGSQSEALTSQSYKVLGPLVLWGWGNSCCPLGLNIVLLVMGPQCGTATLASPFLSLVHSSIQHSEPSHCWEHESVPSFSPKRSQARTSEVLNILRSTGLCERLWGLRAVNIARGSQKAPGRGDFQKVIYWQSYF